MLVATAAQMRGLDAWTIEHGTPGNVLMERAGRGAAEALRRHWRRGRVVVVCGRGNNGGDGFVLARHLKRARRPVEVWLAADAATVHGDAAQMLAAWRRTGARVQRCDSDAGVEALSRRLSDAAVIVDAVFGTGLNAVVDGRAAAVLTAINDAGAPILSMDIASGLSADTGRPLGVAVRATVTATFDRPKVGQVLYPGIDYTGHLEIVDIGLAAGGIERVGPLVELLDPAGVGQCLPPRARDAHKGTFGHVVVIGGSRGKTGAALLATEGAGRSGVGLVTLACAAMLQPVFEGQVREAMTAALPDGRDGTCGLGDGVALGRVIEGRDAIVCGPGLGLTPDTRALVAAVARTARCPVLLDADALNAIAGTALLRERPAATVVTPHPGEMSRLLGLTTSEVQADRVRRAGDLATREGVVVVLKGARTIIADPAGRRAIVPTGNPGMATGGTGDVLAGVIGGFLAQHIPGYEAACLGAFVHGLAGDRVAARQGEGGLLARDLLPEIPAALATLRQAQ